MIDCLTPGAIYHTKIRDNSVSVKVDLPDYNLISLTAQSAERLEMSLHRAIEGVLAGYFLVAELHDTNVEHEAVIALMDAALTSERNMGRALAEVARSFLPK
jgi:hypothetical protein